MKKKILLTFVLIVLTSVVFLGWGDKGHKTIASYGMKNLTSVMEIPKDWQEWVVEHSVDPDYRKGQDKTEPNKHFIDIDYYKEFQSLHMIQSLDSLKKVYPDTVIYKQGMLPWAVEATYNNLVKAFKEHNKKNTLLYMADLAHYIGDAHQPFHSCLNYNGQLTGQKGIHFRYEIDMIDSNLTYIKSKFESGKPEKVKDIRQFVFDIIARSNSFVDLLLAADKTALQHNGTGKYDPMYQKILWAKTKYMTIDQFNYAGKNLASAIYSAWLDAGKPNLKSFK